MREQGVSWDSEWEDGKTQLPGEILQSGQAAFLLATVNLYCLWCTFTNCLGITPYLSSVTWQRGWKYFAVKGTEVWRQSGFHEGSLLLSDGARAPSSLSFPSCAQWPSVSQASSWQCPRILFSLVLCSAAVTVRSRRSAQGELCGWWEKRELAERRRGLESESAERCPGGHGASQRGWRSPNIMYIHLCNPVSTSVKWANKDLPTTPLCCKH